MTHNEFITSLSKNNVDSNIIHFENSVADGCIGVFNKKVSKGLTKLIKPFLL